MTLSAAARDMIVRYAATASSHFCWLKSASAAARSACRSFAAMLPSGPMMMPDLSSVNVMGGFDVPAERTAISNAAGACAGACATNRH